jgi:hypothetical protein
MKFPTTDFITFFYSTFLPFLTYTHNFNSNNYRKKIKKGNLWSRVREINQIMVYCGTVITETESDRVRLLLVCIQMIAWLLLHITLITHALILHIYTLYYIVTHGRSVMKLKSGICDKQAH